VQYIDYTLKKVLDLNFNDVILYIILPSLDKTKHLLVRKKEIIVCIVDYLNFCGSGSSLVSLNAQVDLIHPNVPKTKHIPST